MDTPQDRTITVVLFTLGSLEVYGLQTLQDANANLPPSGLYWRDDGSPQGHGPFVHLFQAMEHYKHTIEQFKRQPVLLQAAANPAQLINVDFAAKKRVHDV